MLQKHFPHGRPTEECCGKIVHGNKSRDPEAAKPCLNISYAAFIILLVLNLLPRYTYDFAHPTRLLLNVKSFSCLLTHVYILY